MPAGLLFRIFADCSLYTLDPYWKDIFLDCSRNKFPKGILYNPKKHELYVRTSATTKAKVVVLSQDSKDTFKIMMDVFKRILGMHSTRDLQFQHDEIENAAKSKAINLNCEWKDIKKKYIRKQLIINYVIKLRDTYKLSQADVKILMSCINLGFQFHDLSPKDVVYRQGEIKKINKLVFNPKTKSFHIKGIKERSIPQSEKLNKPKRIYQSLDKFVKDYKTKYLTPAT